MSAKIIKKYLSRMRIILNELKFQNRSRTEIQINYFKKTQDGNWSFDRTFFFLIHDGRITKLTPKLRSPYGLTEKGRKLLEALP